MLRLGGSELLGYFLTLLFVLISSRKKVIIAHASSTREFFLVPVSDFIKTALGYGIESVAGLVQFSVFELLSDDCCLQYEMGRQTKRSTWAESHEFTEKP